MLTPNVIVALSLVVALIMVGCGEQAPPPTPGASVDLSAAAEAVPQAKAGWSIEAAQTFAAAKKHGHPVLMDFTGSDWCGWCKKLDAEVFSTPRFQDWAAGHVELLEIDFPRGKAQSETLKAQNERLQEQYQINGFPTVLVLDANGKLLGQLGYVPGGPEVWIKQAEALMQTAGR